MNTRSAIQRHPAAINTDMTDSINSPSTSASFSFTASVRETPISPPFSHTSFEKLSLGHNANELPELEG